MHTTIKNYHNLFTTLILKSIIDANLLKNKLESGKDSTIYVLTD